MNPSEYRKAKQEYLRNGVAKIYFADFSTLEELKASLENLIAKKLKVSEIQLENLHDFITDNIQWVQTDSKMAPKLYQTIIK